MLSKSTLPRSCSFHFLKLSSSYIRTHEAHQQNLYAAKRCKMLSKTNLILFNLLFKSVLRTQLDVLLPVVVILFVSFTHSHISAGPLFFLKICWFCCSHGNITILTFVPLLINHVIGTWQSSNSQRHQQFINSLNAPPKLTKISLLKKENENTKNKTDPANEKCYQFSAPLSFMLMNEQKRKKKKYLYQWNELSTECQKRQELFFCPNKREQKDRKKKKKKKLKKKGTECFEFEFSLVAFLWWVVEVLNRS